MKDAPPALPTEYAVVLRQSTSVRYTLDEAARIVQMHPDRLRYYCQLGLFGAAFESEAGEPLFDDDRLYEMRRFEYFRRQHGVDRQTLRLLCGLWCEVERLRRELSYLRSR